MPLLTTSLSCRCRARSILGLDEKEFRDLLGNSVDHWRVRRMDEHIVDVGGDVPPARSLMGLKQQWVFHHSVGA